MGYTHYWTPNFTDEQWTQIMDAANKIIEKSHVPLWYECDEERPPLVSEEMIRFNGVGDDDGHETFMLRKDGDWDFCKTAAKPYDEVVVAILMAAATISEDFSWSSDGAWSYGDFNDGMVLLERATGIEYVDRPKGDLEDVCHQYLEDLTGRYPITKYEDFTCKYTRAIAERISFFD